MTVSALNLAFQGLVPAVVALQVALTGLAPVAQEAQVVGATGGAKRVEQRYQPKPEQQFVWRKPVEVKPAAPRRELERLLAELLPPVKVEPKVAPVVLRLLAQEPSKPVEVKVELDPELVREWIKPLPKITPVAQRPTPKQQSAHEPAAATEAPEERQVSNLRQAPVAPVAALGAVSQSGDPVIAAVAAPEPQRVELPTADTAAALQSRQERNRRLALLAAIILFEQQEG